MLTLTLLLKTHALSGGPSAAEVLERRVEESLAQRVREGESYTPEEIERVAGLDHRIFPQDFELDVETTEHFRALTLLSQSELKPASQITSHRRFVGPLIVALKRLSWPLIRIHLDKVFQGIQEHQSWVTVRLARQEVALREARQTGNMPPSA